MGFIISICFSAFFYILRLINNDIITFTAIAVLIIVSSIYDYFQRKDFINKTFECLVCGHNFKPKWYILSFGRWRMPAKYRVYKEFNAGTYEKLIYKCPKCQNRECVAKD